MGAGEWLTGDRWPLPGTTTTTFYLAGNGNGNGNGNGQTGPRSPGRLLEHQPTGSSPPGQFVSDPDNPVRDPFAEAAGPHDYRVLNERSDVLVFETEPLTEDLNVAGPIKATLFISVDKPDTDLWVKLLDVAPDGTAFNLMSPGLDVIRASYRDKQPRRSLLEPGRVYRLELDNLLTANRFQRGHRVRILVMASFAPHMSRNLHTGLLEMVSNRAVKARISVQHSREHPSGIELSVVPDSR
jgi:putative CocE/NonD family hydrolase